MRGKRTADVVLFSRQDGLLSVLAVERGKAPFRAAIALPGGFANPGERSRDVALRELAEETGLVFPRNRLRRLGCYNEPGRDPRGRVVSVAYHGYLPGAPAVVGRSDARVAQWVAVSDFLSPDVVIGFDHRRIVCDAMFSRFGRRVSVSADVTSPGAEGVPGPVGRAQRVALPGVWSGLRSGRGSLRCP
ncbi:8-oxo-dGTP diphosphatase [Amycolatopsis marina]|uniref:8-oxo-dGTP diphosphatase n=1 Tax=Amycolatopsis marina TaxID=490629 RepID=A0A1I1BEG4_9PSEU|nr:8-oxo-dGTP diphosphatase [Amycolatopsis marina]